MSVAQREGSAPLDFRFPVGGWARSELMKTSAHSIRRFLENLSGLSVSRTVKKIITSL